MKRLYLLVVLSVVGAGVLSMVLNLWIMRTYVARDFEPALRHLRPDIAGTFEPVVEALRATPSRAPEALAAAAGVPVLPLAAAEAAGFAARDPTSVALGAGERLLLDGAAESLKDYAYLGLANGETLRFGPLAPDSFWRVDRLSIWLAVLVFVAMLTSLLVIIPLARGLNRLERTAMHLAGGDFSARAPVPIGATRELSLALNTMAERISGLLANHKELLQAVSHELRTPTARIRFSLEMLEAASTDAARKKRIDAIDRDLAELDELVAELVTFSRVAAELEERDAQPLVLAEALGELAADLRDRRPDVDVTVVAPDDAAAAGAVVWVEARSFRRALRNLLLNAVRHGRSRVELRWTVDGDRAVVTVDDDGDGVAPDDRERIFEPFTRTDASRSRDSGGIGLGLAIVRRIVEVHGGRIGVEDGPLGGARFASAWPMAAPTSARRLG